MKVEISKQASLPTEFGRFTIQSFRQHFKQGESKDHLAIMKGEIGEEINLRVHSECLTGDALGSLKCDCRPQLISSLKYIEKNGGMVIYLRQEGRGIGLFNKINAYALQDEGLNTIEANLELGFKDDERDYEIVKKILDFYKVKRVRIMTNNPLKIDAMNKISSVASRIPIVIDANEFNKEYLHVKAHEMGHIL